jgi:hypothetical protein
LQTEYAPTSWPFLQLIHIGGYLVSETIIKVPLSSLSFEHRTWIAEPSAMRWESSDLPLENPAVEFSLAVPWIVLLKELPWCIKQKISAPHTDPLYDLVDCEARENMPAFTLIWVDQELELMAFDHTFEFLEKDGRTFDRDDEPWMPISFLAHM